GGGGDFLMGGRRERVSIGRAPPPLSRRQCSAVKAMPRTRDAVRLKQKLRPAGVRRTPRAALAESEPVQKSTGLNKLSECRRTPRVGPPHAPRRRGAGACVSVLPPSSWPGPQLSSLGPDTALGSRSRD